MQMIYDALEPTKLDAMSRLFNRQEKVEDAKDKAARLSNELRAKHDVQAEEEERAIYALRRLRASATY